MNMRPLLVTLLSASMIASLEAAADDADQIRDAFDAVRQESGLVSPTEAPAASPTAEPAAPSYRSSQAPVASHIRLKEGIPFPPPDSIVWDPDPPGLRQLLMNTPPITPMPTETPYQRPRKCSQHRTVRTVTRPGEAEEKDKTLYDVLYLPEDLVPLDSEEVYGARARLYPYGLASGESVYSRMELDRVPCLPYRTRMTNSATYEDFGDRALRNYSKDQSGPGVLHAWVSQKLYGRKKK